MSDLRFLCIDGGGIRGIFAVSMLKAMEDDFNKPIADLFDVIAGTSTGAIIATSAVLKKPMKDILKSYQKFGKQIFNPQAQIGLFKSVYSDRYLRKYFKKNFGELTLSDIKRPLLIPAVDATHGKPYVFRSNYGHPESDDLSIKLWDAVLSSCSAPVYFPPNNIKNEYLSVDGGLWANNPSMVCVTEALQHFKKRLEDIQIFSVGTGMQEIEYKIEKDKFWGIKKWLPFQFPFMKITPKLIDLALDLSSESITYHCEHLLQDRYYRLNEKLGMEIPFDDVKYMDKLIDLGKKVYKENSKEIRAFLED